MKLRNVAAVAIIVVGVSSIAVLGARKLTPVFQSQPKTEQQTTSVTLRPGSAPAAASPSPLERNALNTPPEVLNSVNGVLIESQEVESTESSRASTLKLKLRNATTKPVAEIIFVEQREALGSLKGVVLRSADFSEGILLQPGVETTYRVALSDTQPPLTLRLAAVVYGDATHEGDPPAAQTTAASYVAYNAALARILEEAKTTLAAARAGGKSDAEAANDYAARMKSHSDEIKGDMGASGEEKRAYEFLAPVVEHAQLEGGGLAAFCEKLEQLLRDRPTKLPPERGRAASA